MVQSQTPSVHVEQLIRGEAEAIEREETVLGELLQSHPEWAESVLPFLASGQAPLVANARRLLTMFDERALLTIARGYEVDDPTARFEILNVLWAHLIGMTPRERLSWLEALAVYLLRGLDDARFPARYLAEPELVEMGTVHRVCDETYLFLNRLLDSEFDDSGFARMEAEARDPVVKQFGRRAPMLLASPAAKARQPSALAELTFVASFTSEFATQTAQFERDQAKAGQWAPALKDFLAVAVVDTPQPGKAIFEVSGFMEMLGAILFVNPSKPKTSAFRPAQSVKRVNIITHGNPGLIALSGSVDKTGAVKLATHPSAGPDLQGPIDVAAVQMANNPGLYLDNGEALVQSLRDRFAPDAEIFLIACNSASGTALPLMQDLKGLFKVTIRAYSKEIAYCPTLDATHIIDRALTTTTNCNDGSAQRGYKHLKPDRSV
ncbi:hypothetical protein F2P45_19070 [Massilia sp. CCM 8733]|uniref:CHAT domain-containing protein n=1 Tax=Massilia mucilaginosa TaxID=2609282 RepID=A0ABX0NW15_9BURK|nr:hypothetical protein [Massilia mucilaginosa]NHZ91103.1 hypothetical protein [Massilia mucilaginosa]